MKQSSFRDLLVWQKAIALCETIYEISRSFPKEEQFALTSQMQRAAVSIASNIAEGTGRSGAREFAQFLSIATGSAAELETHIELALRLSYIDSQAYHSVTERVIEVKKMLVGLRASVVR